jgi:hypothetical protein
MEDVTVKPHSGTGRHQHGEWVPYVSLSAIHIGSGMPDCIDSVRESQITLCEIMAPCGYLLQVSSLFEMALYVANYLSDMEPRVFPKWCSKNRMKRPLQSFSTGKNAFLQSCESI